MANKAANSYPTETADVAYYYVEKTDGGFVRLPAAKVASSIGVTTGDIWYASAANTLSKLPIGTTGQALVSTGTLPAWGTSGAMGLIQRQSFSAVASVDFTTGFSSAYDEYLFILTDVYPATNATNIWMRISLNAGSTFVSSGSVYKYADMAAFYDGAATASNAGSTGADQWLLARAVGNAAANSVCGTIKFIPRTANASIVSSTTYAGTTATNYAFVSDVGGAIATASLANGVRFLAASGNISGTIAMYGVKNS